MKASRTRRISQEEKVGTGSRVMSKRSTSGVSRNTKRFARKTLRSLLLSKMFQATVKVLIFTLISFGAIYGAYHLIDKTFANEVVISESEIIRNVAKHVTLPQEKPETVVRVQDAETLAKQQAFFADAKTGDYVLIYRQMAIIYDLRNDTVVGMRQTK